MPADTELREVRLLGVPLELQARAEQWHEDLMRELALIDLGDEAPDGFAPARLLALVVELRDRYAEFTDSAREELERARAAGRATVDLTYHVPASVADAADHFDRLLNEADEYCRAGDLLTLAAPPEIAAFRRWFLRQFTTQLRGGPTTAWPDYTDASP